MSGLFAALVSSDETGVRSTTDKIIHRSKERGRDFLGAVILDSDGTVDLEKPFKRTLNRPLSDDATILSDQYQLLGCAYATPPGLIGLPGDFPPFVSSDGKWFVVIDGAVTDFTGQAVANYLQDKGIHGLASLNGQFAILALNGGKLIWATRTKPLYGLYDALNRVTWVASQRDYFDGFYHPIRNPSPFELEPNTYGILVTEGTLLRHLMPIKSMFGSLVLCGGGIDSLVASRQAFDLYGPNITLMYVDYGAKAAEREWEATSRMAQSLSALAVKVPGDVLHFARSPLIPGGETVSKAPKAGIASEWVPARNTVLTAMALSMAESNDLARIITGINMTAASAYPDNEQEWLNRWKALVPYSLNTGTEIDLCAPLATMTKAEIVKLGRKLGVNFTDSWSCYEGGSTIDRAVGRPRHCGLCSSCRARRSAFKSAHVHDPTEYDNGV
jgi:7-cyano-7-deazaguanine synthase